MKVNALVSLPSDVSALSVKVNVPVSVGVPVSFPVAFPSVSPAGRFPPVMSHDTDFVLFVVASNVNEYSMLASASGM